MPVKPESRDSGLLEKPVQRQSFAIGTNSRNLEQKHTEIVVLEFKAEIIHFVLFYVSKLSPHLTTKVIWGIYINK